MDVFLSKSKYLNGCQCHKLLWYYYNEKDKIPPLDDETFEKFNEGHIVGNYAKKLFPDGIEIEWDTDFINVINETKKAINKRKPIFEAGFLFKNTYARTDILNPVNKDEWDIIEVKSSTDVKEIHLPDIAFQKYCFKGAGIRIRKCFIAHINNKYIRNGEIEPDKLFTFVDVSEQIINYENQIEIKVNELINVINSVKPDIKIGSHCNSPYPCKMKDICWDFLPQKNIYLIRRLDKDIKKDLEAKEIYSLTEIPKNIELTDKNKIQINSLLKEENYINKRKIKKFLSKIKYPLHLIDFETTMMSPIPLWDNTSPYQNIPFQYSIHVLNSLFEEPVHYEFLADGKDDPRAKILQGLMKIINNKGSIIAYNVKFEKSIIDKLVLGTEQEKWAKSLENRYIDLWYPFDNLFYYNPEQKKSTSLKAVLPALTGKSYKDMEIGDGGSAAQAFLHITFDEVLLDEKQKVRHALLKYCELDTFGMIDILRVMDKMIK